jgi:hypothetical protein
MYFQEITLKNRAGQEVFLLPGDELVESGIPEHKRSYVSPIGPNGEDVVNPVKGGAAVFEHLTLIPNWEKLVVGARAKEEDYFGVRQRAIWVVDKGIINRTFGPNCEHITSYIRTGKQESPQLFGAFLVGAGVAALVALRAASARR